MALWQSSADINYLDGADLLCYEQVNEIRASQSRHGISCPNAKERNPSLASGCPQFCCFTLNLLPVVQMPNNLAAKNQISPAHA